MVLGGNLVVGQILPCRYEALDLMLATLQKNNYKYINNKIKYSIKLQVLQLET